MLEVIENDFHEYKHLTPNLCALFVEKEYRKKGIAKYILDFVIKDMKDIGFQKIIFSDRPYRIL